MGPELKIGFLGAGKMASALAKGMMKTGLVRPENVLASDPVEAARSSFTREAGARSTASNAEVVTFASVLVLAVKPDQVNDLLSEITGQFTTKHVLISIAAGVPIARFESALGTQARIVRVMPNTPALLGASATGYALGKSAQTEDGELAQKIFSSVGLAYQVKESLLDAVTGLSGSGRAYAFLLIEGVSEGGVAAGLARGGATRIGAETLFGRAMMGLEKGLHPLEHRE